MERIFVIVTPDCPHIKGRKVGSKECTQCDSFRGGIVQNFVDCERNSTESVPKSRKSVPKTAKTVSRSKTKRQTPKKAVSLPVKTHKPKNG